MTSGWDLCRSDTQSGCQICRSGLSSMLLMSSRSIYKNHMPNLSNIHSVTLGNPNMQNMTSTITTNEITCAIKTFIRFLFLEPIVPIVLLVALKQPCEKPILVYGFRYVAFPFHQTKELLYDMGLYLRLWIAGRNQLKAV